MTFRLDFVGVGPLRTGTTWLYQCLQYHPALRLPRSVKETMFFDQHYDQGRAWYIAHFPPPRGEQLAGEIGPTYFAADGVPERIHQLNPRCRIVVNLRNPVARALSHAHQRLSKGRARRTTFGDVIADAPGIVNAGRYALHIPRWLGTFGPDQVLWVLLDDIQARPSAVLASVYDFLGVERISIGIIEQERVGATAAPRFRRLARVAARMVKALHRRGFHRVVEAGKVVRLNRIYAGRPLDVEAWATASDRRALLETYEADIRYVEQLLGRDLEAWRRL